MRRLSVGGLCLSLLVVLSVQAYGVYTPPTHGATGYSGGSGSGEHCYVLIEKTGLDVTCSVLAKMDEVNARLDTIRKDNVEREKGNKVVREEITKLTAKLSTKKQELAKIKDDENAKTEAQKAVDDLNTQIKDKKGELKPLTTWAWPPNEFPKREDAAKFVDQVMKEAQKVKDKAAEKEAKAKG